MTFEELPLPGAYLVRLVLHEDERGLFARTYCRNEFAAQGLDSSVAQCNWSYNQRCGTLRGLHFQQAPYGEAKLVRCIRGAVYDAIVDVRPESPTFGRWCSAELSAENHTMIYIPEGFAHGFESLSDRAELLYQMSREYRPESATGIRWDDPTLAIAWPISDPIVSDRDRALPSLLELFGRR